MKTKLIAAAVALAALTSVASAAGFDPAYTSRDRQVDDQAARVTTVAPAAVRPVNPAFDPSLDQTDRRLLAQQERAGYAVSTNDDVSTLSTAGSGFDPAADSRDLELRALELRAWGK